jgi:hypothetical protein
MTTIRAEEVRIPRHAREAVARHERVVVVNHDRPTFVIAHPDDAAACSSVVRRGRAGTLLDTSVFIDFERAVRPLPAAHAIAEVSGRLEVQLGP